MEIPGELDRFLHGLASRRAEASHEAKTSVLAIDGRSGTGKTTLAQRAATVLEESGAGSVPVVGMDDLYPGWDGLSVAPGLLTNWVLAPLSRGEIGRFQRWDWASADLGDPVEVPPSGWVVVEGVGSGSRVCRPYLSALIWLEADRQVRRRRGLERDAETFLPHWESWARQEDELFAAEQTRSAADLVLDTTTIPASAGSVPDA